MVSPDELPAYTYRPTSSPSRDWLLGRLARPRVLDVGCGVGFMGRVRPDLRWSGIEINAEACRRAAIHYAHVVCGSTTDHCQLEKLGGTFNDTICCDILDHFENPAAALRDLHGLLQPGGRLLVAIDSAPWPLGLRRRRAARSNSRSLFPYQPLNSC